MHEHDFEEYVNLANSLETVSDDIRCICGMLPDIRSCEKANAFDDILFGVDYKVTLKGGADIGIDVKHRLKGSIKHWKDGMPDIPIEWTSGIDAGWTVKGSAQTDYILFRFDDIDIDWLCPFQLLRKAARLKESRWKETYGVKNQTSYRDDGRRYTWNSTVTFVPFDEVKKAVMEAMTSKKGA